MSAMRTPLTVAAIAAVVLGTTTATAAGASTAGARPGPRPATGPVVADGRPDVAGDRRSVPAGPATWIVQLAGEPAAVARERARASGRTVSRESSDAAVRAGQDRARPALTRAGGTVLRSYDQVLNGFEVRADPAAAARIASLQGVTRIERVRVVLRANDNGGRLIGSPQVWQGGSGVPGNTGGGVTIGVIDTGIDYTHADFGGPGTVAAYQRADSTDTTLADGGFPTARVVGGTDLVGDSYDSLNPDPGRYTPAPDPDPLDCQGHGTHVTGTAAGQGVNDDGTPFTGPYDTSTYDRSFRVPPGVAPTASIRSYRIFGCEGSASTAVTAAAIDAAVRDNVDVINMSLGMTLGDSNSADGIASDNATRAGVVVVASAGNSGRGAYVAGTPGTATTVISAAAVDAVSSFPGATIGTGGGIPAINANGSGALPVTARVKVLRQSDGGVSRGCDEAEYAGSAGTIVVTRRGICDRVARARFGERAGAAAVIMINNSSSFPPFEGPIRRDSGSGDVAIAFLGVRQGDGPAVAAADGQSITISANSGVANPAFKKAASFTSAGPRIGDSGLKPDVAAPGVSVRSALVGSGSGAQRLSGTSMAAPHTAGTAALVLSARPSLTPAQVKAALVGTADPTIAGYAPTLTGGGLISAPAAAAALVFPTGDPGTSSLSFGYAPLAGAYEETKQVSLRSTRDASTTYAVSTQVSGDGLGTTITPTASSVTVGASGTRSVGLTISLGEAAVAALPAQADVGLGEVPTISGTVVFTPSATAPGITTLRVPFLLVPRGTSDVRAGSPSPYTRTGPDRAERNLPLTNPGIHAGTAGVYAWGLVDPDESVPDTVDVRAVGVATYPSSVGPVVEFALNLHGRWSTASEGVYEVDLDTNRDGTADFAVVGADEQLALAGVGAGPDGVPVTIVYDLAGGGRAVVDVFDPAAAPNSSTLLLAVPASALGLTSGSAAFSYTARASTADVEPQGDPAGPKPSVDTVDGVGAFDINNPAVSSGDNVGLAPGAASSVTLATTPSAFARNPVRGWMIVTADDGNGAAQADLVAAGDVPAAPQDPAPVVPEAPLAALLPLAALAIAGAVLGRRRRRARG